MTFSPAQFRVWKEDILKGYRFCSCCGQPHIEPKEPSFKTKCITCYMQEKETNKPLPTLYCTDCADDLDNWHRDKGIGRCSPCKRFNGMGRMKLIDSLHVPLPSANYECEKNGEVAKFHQKI